MLRVSGVGDAGVWLATAWEKVVANKRVGVSKTAAFLPAVPQGRSLVLDGWRILAASLVFASHYRAYVGDMWTEGHIGVNIFFIDSAYLLTTQVLTGAKNGQLGSRYWLAFWKRRFAKVYVLHTLLYLALCGAVGLPSVDVFLLNVSLLKPIVPSALFTGLAQAWSLFVEISFYAFFPVVGMFLLKTSGKRLLLAGAVVLAIHAGLAYFFGRYALLYTLPGRAFEFWLGCGLGYLFFAGRRPAPPLPSPEREGDKRFLSSSRFSHSKIGAAMSGFAIAIMSVFLAATIQYLYTKDVATSATDTDFGAWLDVTVVSLVLAVGIGVTLLLSENLSIKAESLVGRLIYAGGQSSYAFYLLHLSPVASGLLFATRYNAAITFVLLWVIAVIVWRYVEYPILRYIRQHW